jgi:hypothetical protein
MAPQSPVGLTVLLGQDLTPFVLAGAMVGAYAIDLNL